ncbi:MAG: PAS domain S-box protein, partial [Acutalibacteraceae bacterium]
MDIEGNIIDVNQQWLDTTGFSRDEIIGKWFGNFLLPEHREDFRDKLSQLEITGQIHSEFEMLNQSGKSLYIAVDGNIVYGSDGDFKQILCILKDITAQKKAEKALQLSERKYRQLYETMAQGVVYQAADGRIISANPAALRILGLTLDQMMGMSSLDPGWGTVREDGSEISGSEHPSMIALRTGKPYGPCIIGVYRPMLNDHVWISVTAIPIFENGESTPSMVYTTFQDITTERKANQQYQLLFNEMVDAFASHEIICDDKGTPINYRFLAVNPAFEKMTGLKAEDIIGKTVLEVLPNTESYWIETYGKVALTGESVSFENYAAATGKYFRVVAYQPAPMQFACTFSDDTTRVQAQKDLSKVLSRLKSLLANSPGPIIIFNSKGDIAEISATAKKILGLSDIDCDAKNMSRLGLTNVVEKAQRLLQSSQIGEKIIETIDVYEIEGVKRYFESRIFPIDVENSNENLFAYLGIDITERMMAEQALKESEKKYSSYIENAPYAVFVVDEKGQYIEANTAASTITGYSKEQLLKMSIRDITAEESMSEAMRCFPSLLETG